MIDLRIDEAVACPAGCGLTAEPEQDGDVTYLACTDCGYEFGYQRVDTTEPSCERGIPEHVRRQASTPVTSLPLLQIGKRQ